VVSKDRAAPFSRKHRRYWLPVTGGMLLIGGINIALGVCTYRDSPQPVRIELDLRGKDAGIDATGTLGIGQLPADVMRAFAVKYPKTIPAGAIRDGDTYVVIFPAGAPHARAIFRGDGTFVSDQ
jgi:hypothetical protein